MQPLRSVREVPREVEGAYGVPSREAAAAPSQFDYRVSYCRVSEVSEGPTLVGQEPSTIEISKIFASKRATTLEL